jgi:WhiB family transcriptional regulator, redox-sensing transcriptional regulator
LTPGAFVKASQASNLPVTRQAVAVLGAEQQRTDSRVRSPDRRPTTDGTTDEIEEYPAMDWRHRALCRDEDPELFFPIGTTGPAVVQIEQAKAVCRRCPVTQSCLEWALSSGQDSGVWGGLSEDERRALKRRTARTRVGTA